MAKTRTTTELYQNGDGLNTGGGGATIVVKDDKFVEGRLRFELEDLYTPPGVPGKRNLKISILAVAKTRNEMRELVEFLENAAAAAEKTWEEFIGDGH